MAFIGNDIISLADPANRQSFTNPRFIRKVMTKKEINLLEKYSMVDELPYLFWTCKESAYKIAIKKGYKETFVPQYFEANLFNPENNSLTDTTSGFVTFQGETFYFRSEIFSEYISTIAGEKAESLLHACTSVNTAAVDEQSFSAREELRKALSISFTTNGSFISFLKNKQGVPYLKIKGNTKPPDISFSHDGNYFSYAFLTEEPNTSHAG